MIKIPLALAICLYLLCIVGAILFAWIRSENRVMRGPSRPKLGLDTITCEICGNKYVDSPADGLSLCPMCNSYNDLREGAKHLPR